MSRFTMSVIAFVGVLLLGGCARASRGSTCLHAACDVQPLATNASILCTAIQSAELRNQSARFALRDGTQLSGHPHLVSCLEPVRLGRRKVPLADVTQLELRNSKGRLPVIGALLGAFGGLAGSYGLAFIGAEVYSADLHRMVLFGAALGAVADAISQNRGVWQTIWKE